MLGTINPFWQNAVDGFYFGNLPLEKNRYTTEQKLGVFDSGWTMLSGPKTEMEFIIKVLTKDMTVTKVGDDIFFSCKTYQGKLPSLFLRFGGYWLEVQERDYVINVDGDTCMLFLGYTEDFWALGMTVMRGYYVIHDYA